MRAGCSTRASERIFQHLLSQLSLLSVLAISKTIVTLFIRCAHIHRSVERPCGQGVCPEWEVGIALFLSFVVIVVVVVVIVVVVVVVFLVVEVVVDNIVICRSASGLSAASRVGKELGSELTGVELVRFFLFSAYCSLFFIFRF